MTKKNIKCAEKIQIKKRRQKGNQQNIRKKETRGQKSNKNARKKGYKKDYKMGPGKATTEKCKIGIKGHQNVKRGEKKDDKNRSQNKHDKKRSQKKR